jgi:glycosyltransferase involved in cell wall biosynthesis
VGKPNSVLYISYDGMTDPLGQSQVIPYLIGLSKLGYNITILSCEKKQRFRKLEKKIRSILSTASINWVPIFYTKKPPILSTIYDFLMLQRKASRLNKSSKFEIVHCRSYIPAIIGLSLKRKYGLRFIFDMRGFWADERVDGALWNLKNPVYKTIYNFFKRVEKNCLTEADKVVTLTERSKTEMLSWEITSAISDKIEVIPCCTDTQHFNPSLITAEQKIELKERLGIPPDAFVLGYLGSIGTWYMLNEMLDFFIALQKRKANTKFLFVTFDEHERIVETALIKGIKKEDIIISPATREETPLFISIFDYSIFFIKPTYSKMASCPTKQGEIMAMGIPIVCNNGVGDVDEIVVKHQSGIIVRYFDHQSAIAEMILRDMDQQKIRTGAISYFSLEKGIEQYSKIYSKLLDGNISRF